MSKPALWSIGLLAVLSAPAFGQAVPSREPTGTHIFPAGGRRGTTVPVRVGGECFPPEMKFSLAGEGLTAPATLGAEVHPRYELSARRTPRDADGAGAAMTYPREWESQIAIAADAPHGQRLWRASGSFGGTAPRPFLVGELPEFIESESNSRPERAEALTLPVVVNGQISGERDLDYYTFDVRPEHIIVCDVLAARIGSPLDPLVELTNERGERARPDELRAGNDPVLVYYSPYGGRYRLSVANIGFGGGPQYVYRLTLSRAEVKYAPFPRGAFGAIRRNILSMTSPIAFAFPPAAKSGETRELDLYFPTGRNEWHIARDAVQFPVAPGEFLFEGNVPLIASESVDLIESDESTAANPQSLPLPASASGRFLTVDDEDWYQFAAKQGEHFAISCRPFPETSSAVPVITVLDAAGSTLAKSQAIDSGGRACQIDWQSPADGTYRLCLRDLQRGPYGRHACIYWLAIERAQPGFSLTLDPDYVNVVQAGRTELDVTIHRTGGFAHPIDLSCDTLPAGVKIEPPQIPAGQSRVKVAVVADETARPGETAVVLRGRGEMAAQQLSIEALVQGVVGGPRNAPLALTVQHRPMFRLTCSEAYQYAHRGTVYPYAMQIERLNGFTGPVTIQLCDRQVQDLDGIEIVEQVVPDGVTSFNNLVLLPETMHVSVQHHSRPYAQAWASFTDQWGQKQTLLAVSEKRCMIRTMPTLVRLRAVESKIPITPGQTVPIRLALDRTPNYSEPMQLELVTTPGFSAEAVRMESGATEAVVLVRVGADAKVERGQTLRFRVTGRHASGSTVVSEASVVVLRNGSADGRRH